MTLDNFINEMTNKTMETDEILLTRAYNTITERLNKHNMTWDEMKTKYNSLENKKDKLRFAEQFSGKYHIIRLLAVLQ